MSPLNSAPRRPRLGALRRPGTAAVPRGERGVVMVIALIALALLLIGGGALVRSMQDSTDVAGNVAFKRDLSNHAERALALVRKQFNDKTITPEATQLNYNYSSAMFATNGNGVPNVLINDTTYGAAGLGADDIVDENAAVSIRYVVDRQCTSTGAFDTARCTATSDSSSQDKGGTDWQRKPGGGSFAVYRVSVRVTGPRNTQSFYQATLTY